MARLTGFFRFFSPSLIAAFVHFFIAPQVSACNQPIDISSAAASIEQAGNPSEQAIDDNMLTRWSGYGVGAELILDLGAINTIGCINIAWYHGDTRSNSFVVTTLDENRNDSSVVYRGTSSGTTIGLETYTLSNVKSRYLKITVNGNTENNWASINEIELMSPTPTFRHPGVLVTQEQLEYVSGKISNHETPWRSVYDRAFGGRFGSLSYSAKPWDIVNCASNSSVDEGCTDEMNDAIAAYTQALLWRYTGDASYAERSIAIMNAWSETITDHTGSNAPLQAGWVAEVWPRAAEIIRYTYSGWNNRNIEQFEKMLREVYLPEVQNGWWGGNNWDLTMIDATMAIAVFIEDRDLFNHAIEMWRGSVPAYIYLEADGTLPNRPRIGSFSDEALRSLWKNPPRLVSGMTMETCRDQGHTAMGLAAIANAAETALIQGVDLYGSESDRLTLAAELHTEYLNGAETPEWLCNGTLQSGGYGSLVTYEILYNHFANRLNTPLRNTREWILSKRTGIYHAMLHMDWEILTHGETGMAGLTQPGSTQIEDPINDAPETNPSEEPAEAEKDDSDFRIPVFLEWLIRR